MKENNDHLNLKWGTLKSWNFSNSPTAQKAYEEYERIGSSSLAMMQEDSLRQKELICEMIESVNGSVMLDWEGEDVTNNRAKAKEYVMNYGKEKQKL
jgi:hypothetical protein